MTRLSSIATQLMVVAALATPALAEGQSEIASKLNEEGKELMFAGKFAEATVKFQEAVARVPEAKYFFNLCTSQFQEGKFSAAMVSCNAVANNKPTPELQAKTDKLVGRIEAEAKAQNIVLRPEGGGGGDTNLPPAGDPNQPPPNPGDPNPTGPTGPTGPVGPVGYTPAEGRPPSQGVFQGTTSDNKYTWTLGIDLFGGGGQVGQPDYYGAAASGFRLKSDYLMRPATRVGAQAYLQYTTFGQDTMQPVDVGSLDVIDVGLAAYKHLCPRQYQRLCLTPLVGAQLSVMSPNSAIDVDGNRVYEYAALGARLELGLQWGLGKRMEHVLGVQMGLNAYSAVFSGPTGGTTIADAGLDKGGAVAYFGLGYTYRFNTPLGSSPFVTLE